MVEIPKGLVKVADKAVKGGMAEAGLTVVQVVPKVVNGEVTVEEGSRQVIRSGARGTATCAAGLGAKALVAGFVATVSAPASVTVAIGLGAAWAAGSLFDWLFD